ncbi:MAG: AbrB/MazE/SpoVT family DNA-binding domain-containing protein [bacterium]|nr:AbrB/MazE/SpoVT family DNA-binding domain-containing protein [bacterium]
MQDTAKISSKRQITIPAKVFNLLRLKEGDELSISVEKNQMIMEKAQSYLDSVAGSLPLPEKYKNKSLEMILAESKSEYFTSKLKK